MINVILKKDQEDHAAGHKRGKNCNKDSSTGLFDNVTFSPRDWKDLNTLNQELKIYKVLTKSMEGDGPTGVLVLPKYLELKELLEEKIKTARQTEAPLYPFYTAMLKRVQKYLDEAMECETLILATIVHPCFRLHIFELGFGFNSVESKQCLELLKSHFKTYQDLREILEKRLATKFRQYQIHQTDATPHVS